MNNFDNYLLGFVSRHDQQHSYEKDLKILKDCLKVLSEKTPINKATKKYEVKISNIFSSLISFKEYKSVFLYGLIDLGFKSNDAFLSIISKSSREEVVRHHYIYSKKFTELEFVGYIKLRKNYGHTYMRPETFGDRVSEWLESKEIDFDFDKDFSRKYYVLSNDEEKLRSSVTPEFLAAIRKHKDLEIEILNNHLITRTRKTISPKTAESIVQLISDLSKSE